MRKAHVKSSGGLVYASVCWWLAVFFRIVVGHVLGVLRVEGLSFPVSVCVVRKQILMCRSGAVAPNMLESQKNTFSAVDRARQAHCVDRFIHSFSCPSVTPYRRAVEDSPGFVF